MALKRRGLHLSARTLRGVFTQIFMVFDKQSKPHQNPFDTIKGPLAHQCKRFIGRNCVLRCDHPYPGTWSVKNHVCFICGKSFYDIKGLNIHLTKQHSSFVIQTLRKNSIKAYKDIFGRENFKGISGNCMDFKNAITVNLKGNYEGIWTCWTDGSRGGPIKAIMRVNPDISYAEAIKMGALIAGISDKDLKANKAIGGEFHTEDMGWSIKESRKNLDSYDKAQNQRKLVAQEIWDKSVELEGSLGEVYLVKHRRIPPETIPRLEFKFLPHRSPWETISYTDYDDNGMPYKVDNITPSLVVPVKDINGNISGIQRIFLDKNSGGKPKFKKQNKYSKGVLNGAAGVVQTGQPGQILFVAEGPETGASIAAVVDENSPVLVSLSLMNFDSMAEVILSYRPEKIILAADNDSAKEKSSETLNKHVNTLKKHIMRLSDIPFKMILPELNGSEKQNVDWNDVLVVQGLESLSDQLWTKVNRVL